jgi:imidazolonepropionase-like amidohydrolase
MIAIEAKNAAALALAACLLAPAATAQKTAIKAGRIITRAGADIENGVIVMDGGRITAIGAADDVKVPWDATVIDGQDMTAFPGFVEAYSYRGMDRPNENVDVAPFLNVRDSIDPVSFYFEDSLRWGVTTINIQQGQQCVIGGQGLVVKPHGMTVEQMLVKNNAGIVLSATPKSNKSSATQAQELRKAFEELRRYLEGLVREKKDGGDAARREALFQGVDPEELDKDGVAMSGAAWTVEGLDLVPRAEVDEKQAPLLRLVEGQVPAFFICYRPMDVHRALEIARDNGFLARTTLVLGASCWKAADVIAEAGVPVVLSSSLIHTERDPITGEETDTFVPGVFQAKGVRYALSSSNSSTESLWYQAAMSVGHGLTRDQALDAVTTTPAEILGLGKRVGTLEKGKDGNVLLFAGDPLSVTSFVEHVVIEGRPVYDRSKDVRMKHLLEGVVPPGTAAADIVHDEGHVICCENLGEEGEEPEQPDPGEEEDEEKEKQEEEGEEKEGEHK